MINNKLYDASIGPKEDCVTHNKQYDAVIFDLFGTLLKDYIGEDYRRSQETIAGLLSVDVDTFLPVWAQTRHDRDAGRFGSLDGDFRNVCNIIGVEADAAQIEQAVHVRLDIYRRTFFPRPDTAHTLSQLRASGHKIGLISDCGFDMPMVWKTLPIAPLIDHAVFSCEAGTTKPDPRVYHAICDHLGVEPSRCLYVGDGGSRELTGAAQLGMQPVLIRTTDDITYPYDPAGRLDAIEWQGPVVSSLSELLDMV